MDFETAKNETVTLREKDTMEQIRLPVWQCRRDCTRAAQGLTRMRNYSADCRCSGLGEKTGAQPDDVGAGHRAVPEV